MTYSPNFKYQQKFLSAYREGTIRKKAVEIIYLASLVIFKNLT